MCCYGSVLRSSLWRVYEAGSSWKRGKVQGSGVRVAKVTSIQDAGRAALSVSGIKRANKKKDQRQKLRILVRGEGQDSEG